MNVPAAIVWQELATRREESMRVFVTGGTGYIGSRLIPALIGRGHRVAALARRESAQRLA